MNHVHCTGTHTRTAPVSLDKRILYRSNIRERDPFPGNQVATCQFSGILLAHTIGNTVHINKRGENNSLQCFDTVGWATGRASDL